MDLALNKLKGLICQTKQPIKNTFVIYNSNLPKYKSVSFCSS